jgi:hypothetical protein
MLTKRDYASGKQNPGKPDEQRASNASNFISRTFYSLKAFEDNIRAVAE